MTPYDLVCEYVLHINRSIFLTGKAGTGKTTLLRRTLAAEQGKQNAPYLIAQTKLLVAISKALPQTKRELLTVKGMGQKKYDLMGEKVLALVRKYQRRPS